MKNNCLLKFVPNYGKRSLNNLLASAEEDGRLIYNKKENEESSQGITQVQYEGNINDNSSSNNSILNPTEKVKKQNSDRDSDEYSRIQEMQIELNQTRDSIKAIESSDEFKLQMEKLSKGIGTIIMILKNSIKINDMMPREDNIEKSYIFLGVAKDSNDNYYYATFVVNSYSNTIASMDVVYSANAKKESAEINSPRLSTASTDSIISIAELLKKSTLIFRTFYPKMF